MDIVLQQPVAIPPGSGKILKFLGVTHKLTEAQTAGAFYLCEAVFPGTARQGRCAPESGSPLHIHHYEAEVIHVLEGAIDIRLDTKKLHAPVGGTIHLPKNIPHALQNPLKTPLRIIVYAIPGGLENYFDEVEAALQNNSLDNETHVQISMKYGLEWLE
ncbi:MAG TPA: cupin domain-containing protein [Anaerolineales bacterium]|nr:cupin domain-containing protein [Anaerolineales bacterium]